MGRNGFSGLGSEGRMGRGGSSAGVLTPLGQSGPWRSAAVQSTSWGREEQPVKQQSQQAVGGGSPESAPSALGWRPPEHHSSDSGSDLAFGVNSSAAASGDGAT